MNHIKAKKLAIASGITGSIVYIGCFLIMTVLGKEGLVKSANLLFHGVDFSHILRTNITIGESLLGVVVSFVFWGLIGYLLAFVYNKLK